MQFLGGVANQKIRQRILKLYQNYSLGDIACVANQKIRQRILKRASCKRFEANGAFEECCQPKDSPENTETSKLGNGAI